MASVTVTYVKEGTKPPLYLAGSFSAWEPQEMEYEIPEGQQEHRFYKTIQAEEGKEFQYKFRIGHGDWWVLDETAPVVTDNAGNRNNLLVIPTKSESKMSDQIIQEPQEEQLANVQPIDAEPEKDMSGEELQLVEMTQDKNAATEVPEVSGETGEGDKDSKTAEEGHEKAEIPLLAVQPPTMNEPVPTLIVEKTDDSPSYGEDFGPHATVAEKDAHAMRSADAEPDYVVIQPDKAASTEAETIAEVFESATLVDERAKTPDISDEEAGKIGLRRMSSTPIPEVASTAAEVADSAAILDERPVTPQISDIEAGQVGLRRMSTTPIADVADTAAEVADSATTLDREESETPDLTDKEAGQIGLRRLSTTPIPMVAETAAEVAAIAATLDEGSLHIDIPASPIIGFDDDDDKEYPITPEHEKAPLLSHERFIPGNGISPPKSPEYSTDPGSDSPAIYPWQGRARSFSHDRYVEPGSRNSPRSADRIPTPEADRPYPLQFQLEDFPTTREGIMALIEQTQRDLPEDEVRLTSPSSPNASPSQQFGRPDVLTPGASPQIERRNSPLDSRSISPLVSIAEENDYVAAEDAEKQPNGSTEEIIVDDSNLNPTEYAQISTLVENATGPEQALKSDDQNSEKQTRVESDEVQPKQESAHAVQKAADEAAEEIVIGDLVSQEPEQELVPMGLPLGSSEQELEKAPAEFLDKVVSEGSKDSEIEQVDGNINSKEVTPAEPTSQVIEIGDDAISDDTPKTTPPTSSDGGPSYFSSLITTDVTEAPAAPRELGSEQETHSTTSDVAGPKAPAIVIHPATPVTATAISNRTSTSEREAAIEEEAIAEAQTPEPQSTPMPDEDKVHIHTNAEDTTITATPVTPSMMAASKVDETSSAQDGPVEKKASEETPDSESKMKTMPAPDEVKAHVHTQQEDTVTTKTIAQDTSTTKLSDLVTESTITQRKPGKSSTERSESTVSDHGSTSPLAHRGEQEHPGFFQVICTAVMNWFSGFFATLCGDGGREKDKKNKKKGVVGGNVKRVIGVSAVVILVAVVMKTVLSSGI